MGEGFGGGVGVMVAVLVVTGAFLYIQKKVVAVAKLLTACLSEYRAPVFGWHVPPSLTLPLERH